MKAQTRALIWITFAVIVCLLLPFGIYWRDTRLALALGREAGATSMPAIRFSLQTFFVEVLACFLGVSILAWRTKMRLSVSTIFIIGVLALGCGIIAEFGSVFVSTFSGKVPAEYYLDGFAERVSNSGIESNAVAWAEQVFADQSLNPKGYESIDLPTNNVPLFFIPVFNKMGTPEARVDYFKNRTEPESVTIHVWLGDFVRSVEWGITIFKGPNTNPNWVITPLRCGKRLFVFYYVD